MGTFGPGAFDNDDAQEWLDLFGDTANLESLHQAFASVSGPDKQYVEAPEAARAIAAAEVVAALAGRPGPGLPEPIQAVVEGLPAAPSQELTTQALRAVDRVRTDSELSELWASADPEDARAWETAVTGLAARLEASRWRPRPSRSKPDRPRRPAVRSGDLVRIPVCGQSVVGLVLHVSQYFKDGLLVGVFPRLYADNEAVDPAALDGTFVETPNYSGAAQVRSGRWTIVSHSDNLLSRYPVPALWSGGSLYWKDELVAHTASAGEYNAPRISAELLHAHTPYTFYGPGALEMAIAGWLCPDEANAERLHLMRDRGADLASPRRITHRLYFKEEHHANVAREQLPSDAYDLEIRFGPASKCLTWQLRATQHTVADVNTIRAVREQLSTVAVTLGGFYDGVEISGSP